MREQAVRVMGSVPADSYLATGLALARWAILDRLHRLKSRVLLIAAENDFTPLAEKRELAARLSAELVVVRGSRHGTPFDSVEVTNASLLALLTDQPLPPPAWWVRDTPDRTQALSLKNSIAEEHALEPETALGLISLPRQAVKIQIAAAQDDADALCRCRQTAFHDCRISHCARGFNNELHDLPNPAHRLDDRFLAHGHNVIDQTGDFRERPLA